MFSCYRPVDPDTPSPAGQAELHTGDTLKLIALAHLDRGELFRRYSECYQSTNGQVYWSETNRLADYIDRYHQILRPPADPARA